MIAEPTIIISSKLQMKNDNIVVHINSRGINWETSLIQPKLK